MDKTKDVVAGMGEIGKPIYNLISKKTKVFGYDVNPKLIDKKQNLKLQKLDVRILHVCIPFNKKFFKNIRSLCKKFDPKIIVIHSTVTPGTTIKLQKEFSIPVIYSATRGIHKRMLPDLKRYSKFYAIEPNAPRERWASKMYSNQMKICGVKTKKMSKPITLELAKILVDTTYYGWLISYAQITNMIALKYKVNYDEMWSFSDEIHKFLGNRPKMFPGFIGGHCVIPNLDLIKEKKLDQINDINKFYLKKIKSAKSIAKKYFKGKQSYNKK